MLEEQLSPPPLDPNKEKGINEMSNKEITLKVNELVELKSFIEELIHAGRIWIERNDPEKGITVFIALPRKGRHLIFKKILLKPYNSVRF